MTLNKIAEKTEWHLPKVWRY